MNIMKCVDCKKKQGSICLDDEIRCNECKLAKWPCAENVIDANDVSNESEGNEVKIRDNSRGQSQSLSEPVINELLCFVANKMDSLPFDYLVKLCSDFYADTEIEAAKQIVLQLGSPDKRYPKRKGQYKKISTMQDILHILLELETSHMPLFVARDLGNLPPLSYDHFDVSKLLHDVESVRNEINLIKHSMSASSSSREAQQNTATPFHSSKKMSKSENVVSQDNADEQTLLKKPLPEKSQPSSPAASGFSFPANSCDGKGPMSTTPSETSTQWEKPDEQPFVKSGNQPAANSNPWIEVTRKKRNKNPAITGTGGGKFSLKTANRRPTLKCLGIFVSRLHRDTSPEHVSDHLLQSQDLQVAVEKLPTKFSTYTSFLVKVEPASLEKLLVAEAWPQGALIRKYYESNQ